MKRWRKTRLRQWCLSALALACFQSLVCGQTIRMQEGPYYVGEPVLIQLSVSSDGEQPTVKFAGSTTGLTVRGPDVSVSSSRTVINGRRLTSNDSYTFRFSVTSTESGVRKVGPFEVERAGETVQVQALEMNFEELADASNMFLEIRPETNRAYVGQSFPVKVKWGYAASINKVRYVFARLRIQSSLFDQLELNATPSRTEETLVLQTGDKAVELDADIAQERIDGQNYITASATVSVRATKTGRFSIESRCRSKQLIASGGFFGNDRTAPIVARSLPLEMDLLAVPDGGPATFTGAIGERFSITTRLERSKARVGDPIPLTVSIQGGDGIEYVRLPDWSESEYSEQFQFPSESPAGQATRDAKTFDVTIRAKEPGITELPGLEFSWFDPKLEKFVTTTSRALPFEVSASDLVSSASVYSATPNEPRSQAASGDSGKADFSSRLAANLAIATDPILISQSSYSVPKSVLYGFYVVASCLIAFSCIWRIGKGRVSLPAKGGKRNRVILAKLSAARGQPPAAGAKEVANALREYIRGGRSDLLPEVRSELEEVLAKCEAIEFSPAPDSHSDELNKLAGRASQIVSGAR